jgi:nicotinate-nucleotide pyrophosphorylase
MGTPDLERLTAAAMDAAIEAALREDMPSGDLTSETVIPAGSRS